MTQIYLVSTAPRQKAETVENRGKSVESLVYSTGLLPRRGEPVTVERGKLGET